MTCHHLRCAPATHHLLLPPCPACPHAHGHALYLCCSKHGSETRGHRRRTARPVRGKRFARWRMLARDVMLLPCPSWASCESPCVNCGSTGQIKPARRLNTHFSKTQAVTTVRFASFAPAGGRPDPRRHAGLNCAMTSMKWHAMMNGRHTTLSPCHPTPRSTPLPPNLLCAARQR
jgi:hypothetical protein